MGSAGRGLSWAICLSLAGAGAAPGYSLLGEGGLLPAALPLLGNPAPEAMPERAPEALVRPRAEIADTAEAEEARGRAQSLFIGTAKGGLFAPLPPRDRGRRGRSAPYDGGFAHDFQAAMIRELIASAEAGSKGYDAVQYGARIRPVKPPTEMTLGEIFEWIRATPRQPHAIGRYQFIPKTLARLVEMAGYGANDRFTPEMQDRLADILLAEAGLQAYRAGAMPRRTFMNNLAKIWAGLPNSTGHSHYHGYAGNAAAITWDRFEREMARIFQG